MFHIDDINVFFLKIYLSLIESQNSINKNKPLKFFVHQLTYKTNKGNSIRNFFETPEKCGRRGARARWSARQMVYFRCALPAVRVTNSLRIADGGRGAKRGK